MITYSFDAEKVSKWVCQKAGGKYQNTDTAIGQENDGNLIVGVRYYDYNKSSICMDSRCDDRGHVVRGFYWMIFDYPFNQLHVRRITLLVSSANKQAIKVNEKLGFKRETTLSDYFPDGDGIVYVMRREDCRWLGVRNGIAMAA